MLNKRSYVVCFSVVVLLIVGICRMAHSSGGERGFRVDTPKGWSRIALQDQQIYWNAVSDGGKGPAFCSVKVNDSKVFSGVSNSDFLKKASKNNISSIYNLIYSNPRVVLFDKKYVLGGQQALHAIISGKHDGKDVLFFFVQSIHNDKLYTVGCFTPKSVLMDYYTSFYEVFHDFEFVDLDNVMSGDTESINMPASDAGEWHEYRGRNGLIVSSKGDDPDVVVFGDRWRISKLGENGNSLWEWELAIQFGKVTPEVAYVGGTFVTCLKSIKYVLVDKEGRTIAEDIEEFNESCDSPIDTLEFRKMYEPAAIRGKSVIPTNRIKDIEGSMFFIEF